MFLCNNISFSLCDNVCLYCLRLEPCMHGIWRFINKFHYYYYYYSEIRVEMVLECYGLLGVIIVL